MRNHLCSSRSSLPLLTPHWYLPRSEAARTELTRRRDVTDAKSPSTSTSLFLLVICRLRLVERSGEPSLRHQNWRESIL